MRILISLSHCQIGGAQTLVARLAKELSVNHSIYLYDYEIFSAQQSDSILNLLPEQVRILRFSPLWNWVGKKLNGLCQRLHLNFNAWLLIRSLHFKWLLFFHQIDLVNTHLFHSDRFVTQTLKQSHLPIVLTDHGDYYFVVERHLGTSQEIQQIFDRVNQIIYISDSNKAFLAKYVKNVDQRGIKIYNGVSQPDLAISSPTARSQLNISNTDFVFGMVARGIPEKGWAEAIAAFRQVHAQQQATHLILVGASPYLSSLQQALEPDLRPFVHFTGHTSNPNHWIAAFDVGLLPTYFPGESLPNSIIEYLSIGKPTIATHVGGIPEMLTFEDEPAGITIELTESGIANVAELMNAMLNYLNSASLLEQHSQQAQHAFQQFSLEQCAASYEAVFSSLVNSKSR
jgi:L-malate glycosyltransferase